MKRLTKLFCFVLVVAATSFIINSCSKDESTTLNGGSSTMSATLAGMVMDESNVPLSGVTVTAYGLSTTTSQFGTFVFKNISVNKSRCLIQLMKDGYFNRAHAFIPSGNTVNYVTIVMVGNTATQNFSAAAGGLVTLPDNASVLFSPNSIVTSAGSAYTGTVSIAIKHLQPGAENFDSSIPGGDLIAKDKDNKEVVLYSYGMLGVQLTGSNGEALNLASGRTASLTMPIAAAQLVFAPETLPLWYFDETTALWKEEGHCNLVGNNYVGTVTHFSWWNCDYSGPSAKVKGRVVDINGIPMPNVHVWNTSWGHGFTDQNGEYNGLILAGEETSIYAIDRVNQGLHSTTEIIPALSINQTYNVPDLIINPPTSVTGTITGCDGSSTNALVYISWNGGYNYRYCNTGSYNIGVPSNTVINIRIYEGATLQSKTITTGAPSIITDVGNTTICSNNSGQPDNSFYLDGNGHNHELIQIDTLNTSARQDSLWPFFDPFFMISIHGYNHSTAAGVDIYINLIDSIPSNYLCSSYGTNSIGINFFSIENYSSSQIAHPVVSLSEVQFAGGRVIGTFSGTMATDTSSTATTVTITDGKFNVSRH